MRKNTSISLYALLAISLIYFNRATAAEINWLDVSTIPGASDVVINDPILGQIGVTTDSPAQMLFLTAAGSFANYTWSALDYITYDASSAGTNAPISGTMTFTFLSGPINTALTPLFFSSEGLAAGSSYIVNNNPIFLGDITNYEGTGTRTPVDQDSLRIDGTGFNHNADLFQFNKSLISSISINIDQIRGDGAGFAIGTVLNPEASPVPLPASLWLLISGCATLIGLRRKQTNPATL